MEKKRYYINGEEVTVTWFYKRGWFSRPQIDRLLKGEVIRKGGKDYSIVVEK